MLCSVFSLFPSVDYFSDESSLSGTSGNAGGGESDSDSSYCPTSDRVVKKGPVPSSIVIHPLVLQWPSCSKRPESPFALQCGVTLLLFLIGLAL